MVDGGRESLRILADCLARWKSCVGVSSLLRAVSLMQPTIRWANRSPVMLVVVLLVAFLAPASNEVLGRDRAVLGSLQTIELAAPPVNAPQRSRPSPSDSRLDPPPRTTDTPDPNETAIPPASQQNRDRVASRPSDATTPSSGSAGRQVLSIGDRAAQAAESFSNDLLRGATRTLQAGADPTRSNPEVIDSVATEAFELKAGRFVVRVTMGGGSATLWRGHIEARGGEIIDYDALGMQIDESVAMRLDNKRLLIEPMVARAFDAVDLVWDGATSESELIITLADADRPDSWHSHSITLAELLVAPGQWPLDDSGNRVQIARAPGDRIPVSIARDHLVFEPGEVFEFETAPHAVLDPNELHQFEVKIFRARTQFEAAPGQVIPEVSDLRDTGRSLPIAVTMPAEQGAYTVRLDVVTRRGTNPFVRPRVVASRSIDVIVASSKPGVAHWEEPQARTPIVPNLPIGLPRRLVPSQRGDQQQWSVLHVIEPGTSQWNERLRQFDAMNLVKRFRNDPIGSQAMQFERLEDRTWMKLEPGQWYAFPLPVTQLASPHRLDIQTSLHGIESEFERIMGVSIVEPDAKTWERIPQADIGFALRPPHTTGSATQWLETAEANSSMHFWPQSRSPWVIVSNLSKSRPLYVGTIELSAGPAQLEAAPSTTPLAPDARRLTATYLRRPELDASFQPTRLAEGSDVDWLEDWTYFEQGLDRLIQQTKASGLNAVAINIASDGGCWFPSEALQAGTRWDRGRFSDLGRDPLPKDLVELMLRKFDAAGLALVPVFDFNAPLPLVERTRRESNEYDVDQWDDSNSTLRRQRSSVGRADGFYDPAHPVVANALVDVISEFITRYETHPSLAGIAVRVGPGSHLFYAGAQWGMSRTNLERFANDMSLSEPQSSAQIMQGEELRADWLSWRAARMTDLFRRMQETVSRTDSLARRRLYIVGEDWYQGTNVLRRLHPTPRGRELDINGAALEVGFEIPRIRQMESIVLVQSLGIQPRENPSARRLERVLWSSRVGRSAALLPVQENEVARASAIQSVDHLIGSEVQNRSISVWANPSGLLVQRKAREISLTDLLPVTTAGVRQGNGSVRPTIVDEAAAERRALIEGIVEGDVVLLMDEAWSVPTNVDPQTREFLAVIQELPAYEFLTLNLPGSDTSAVMLRAAVHSDRMWVYFVNPSPWPVTATLRVRSVTDPGIERLGASRFTADRTLDEEGEPDGGIEIQAELPPFGIAAFTAASSMKLERIESSVSPEVLARVQQELDVLLTRVNEMGLDSATKIEVDNADFEQTTSSTSVPAWITSSSGVQVRASDDAFEGARVLAMSNRGTVAWARSRTIEAPRSGRLSLKVLVRSREGQPPAALRLSLEAQTPEGSYYQFAQIGASDDSDSPAIGNEWTPFAVHFDDLPCDSLSELRVGFDLMSEGDVEIDSLEVLDGWFDAGDQRVLFQRISVARLQLQQGNAIGPYRLLESYWARVILSRSATTEVTPLVVPTEPRTAAVPADSTTATPAAPATPRSLLERVRDFVPAPRSLR